MKNQATIISNIKSTDNFVIVEFDATLDTKAKKLSQPKSVFFTHDQAKKIGLNESCIGFEFESKRV